MIGDNFCVGIGSFFLFSFLVGLRFREVLVYTSGERCSFYFTFAKFLTKMRFFRLLVIDSEI